MGNVSSGFVPLCCLCIVCSLFLPITCYLCSCFMWNTSMVYVLHLDGRTALFLFGGLNCHCIHRVLPTLPRSLHLLSSRKLFKLYPEEYRSINTISQLFALFILRSEVFTTPVRMEGLPRKVWMLGPYL